MNVSGFINPFLLVLFLLSGLGLFGQEEEFLDYVKLDAPAPSIFNEASVRIESPRKVVEGELATFTLKLPSSDTSITSVGLEVNGQSQFFAIANGKGKFTYRPQKGDESFTVSIGDFKQKVAINPVPSWLNKNFWLSLLPPLVAIFLALIFREVIVSLFLGIFMGAALLGYHESGSLMGIWSGFLEVIKTYVVGALYDHDHISVIVFSLLIGGLVAIISKNGGMQGVVNIISRMAKTARSGQLATWYMGIAIFFDDYANALVVGNTMRSITDKLRISREKLAYIVDSTAAPVSALAFITTWIGAELGYIGDGLVTLQGFPDGHSPYSIFLNSLAYSFYPIFTLVFILVLIYSGRDFGPMLKAEKRTRSTGKVRREEAVEEARHSETTALEPDAGTATRAINAIVPILVLIAGVIMGLAVTGLDGITEVMKEKGLVVDGDKWRDVWSQLHLLEADGQASFLRKLGLLVGESDSYAALLWASLTAVVVAIFMTVIQGIMSIVRAAETMVIGFKTMLGAVIILVLAWSLANVTLDLHTATYLTEALQDILSPVAIPALTFLLAAAIAFSTGSSWSTMAILYPLMIPLIWSVATGPGGMEGTEALPYLYNVVSAVLAGSVLGDHCSPISDTTILSSLACDCNHIDHVRTQLPYALVVGGVSVFIGTIPSSYGLPWWVTFPVGIAVMIGVVMFLGRKSEEENVDTDDRISP